MLYISKLITVFVNMDSMVGKDFEAGLANLKTVTENQPVRQDGARAMQKITPFLWFDTQAEAAAKFYASVSKLEDPEDGPLRRGRPRA